MTEQSKLLSEGADSLIVIEPLQLKDAEVVRQLVRKRVFYEDVWRLARQNLTQARGLGIVLLCTGVAQYFTGSVLYSTLIGFGAVPLSYALYLRHVHIHTYLENNCQDVCRGGQGLYDYWSDNADGRKLVVAKIDNKVAGTAAVSRIDKTSAEMQRIAVDTAYAGKGIGRLLMGHLIEHCKERGFHDIIIQVTSANKRALSIYKKYGFQDHIVIQHWGILRWTAIRLRLPLSNR